MTNQLLHRVYIVSTNALRNQSVSQLISQLFTLTARAVNPHGEDTLLTQLYIISAQLLHTRNYFQAESHIGHQILDNRSRQSLAQS